MERLNRDTNSNLCDEFDLITPVWKAVKNVNNRNTFRRWKIIKRALESQELDPNLILPIFAK